MTGSLFAKLYAHFPPSSDQPCVSIPDHPPLTWGIISEWSARYASFFSKNGLEKGDRVLVHVHNQQELLFIYLACLRAGLIFVYLDPRCSPGRVRYVADACHPQLVICTPDCELWLKQHPPTENPNLIFTLAPQGSGTFSAAASTGSNQFPIVECTDQDPAALIYPPHTTYGFVLTHGSLFFNARTLAQAWHLSHKDTLLHATLPTDGCGIFTWLHAAMLRGARTFWISQYEATSLVEALPEATVCIGSPALYKDLVEKEAITKDKTRTLRLFVSGPFSLPPDVHAAFAARTGHVIYEYHGSPQVGIIAAMSCTTHHRIGTPGPAAPEVSVQCSTATQPQRPRTSGTRFWVKTPGQALGYWEGPNVIAPFKIQGGWVESDLYGTVDRDHYIYPSALPPLQETQDKPHKEPHDKGFARHEDLL